MRNVEKQQKISTILFVIITAIFFFAMLSGCSTTVPVTAKFPNAPENLLVKCPQLEKLGNEVKLSDISKTVTTNYTTSWFYDDRYVQNKTFERSLYVVRPVDENTQIVVNVYHDFNSELITTSHTIDLMPVQSGSSWGTGVFGTATFGESDLREGIQRGGRLKRAKATQLEFIGPTGLTTGTVGRQWGLNSIAYKYKRRKVRSQK